MYVDDYKQLKVQYREKPPNELLRDIEEVVRRYPGVELAPVELEQWKEVSTSCSRTRPPGLRAAPQKKSKKGYSTERHTQIIINTNGYTIFM